MSIKRPSTTMNKEALIQLISDITAVEDFYKKPIIKSQNNMKSRIKYSDEEDDLPDKVRVKVEQAKAKPNSSSFFYTSSPDPVLRNEDNTLTKEGEKSLLIRMKDGGVDIGEDDDISLDPKKSSLTGHLVDLKYAVSEMETSRRDSSSSESEDAFYSDTESLGSFASEDSSPSASPPHSPALSLAQQPASSSKPSQAGVVDLNLVKELPAFKALEKAYLYRAGVEGKNGIKTHALLAQFLMEARGQSNPDLMTQYAKQMDQGKQHEYIVKMVDMIHKADISNTPRKR